MSRVTSSTATNSPNFLVIRSTLTKGLACGSVQGSNLSCLSRVEVAMRLRSVVAAFGCCRSARAALPARREPGPGPVQVACELLRPGPPWAAVLQASGQAAAGPLPARPFVSSLAGSEAGPRPVEKPRELIGLRQVREQLGLDLRRRIDAGVVAHVLVHEWDRRSIAGRVVHEVRVRRGDLGLHHEVDESMCVVRMRSVGRDRVHVEPDDRSFLRYEILDDIALPGLVGTVACLKDIAAPAEREADLAVRERVDVLRAVDHAYIGPY